MTPVHLLCLLPALGRRILDNLPIGMVRMREDDGEQIKTYERGFPVGFMDVSARQRFRAARLARLQGQLGY